LHRDAATVQRAIGQRIREIRNARGISQEPLAFKCGLHRTHMSAIERGLVNITIQSLVAILDALDVSLEEFFRGMK